MGFNLISGSVTGAVTWGEIHEMPLDKTHADQMAYRQLWRLFSGHSREMSGDPNKGSQVRCIRSLWVGRAGGRTGANVVPCRGTT